MALQLFDGAWCKLRNGRLAGPATSVVSSSGHQFLVSGLYYTAGGECQSGWAFDVIDCGKTREGVSDAARIGAEVIALATMGRADVRHCVTAQAEVSASSGDDAETYRSISIASATSFGLISGSVSFRGDGSVFVSDQCLQIANGEPMALSERALDRCGILRGDKWLTFREVLVEAATREVAA